MNFHKQHFEGVWLIEAESIPDNRGAFRRHFCQKEFKNIFVDTIQVPISYNKEKINEVKIRISLNGIYEYIPYNFEIIELAEELVQIKGELELSRSFFKIGMGKWYSTIFLKENIHNTPIDQ